MQLLIMTHSRFYGLHGPACSRLWSVTGIGSVATFSFTVQSGWTSVQCVPGFVHCSTTIEAWR